MLNMTWILNDAGEITAIWNTSHRPARRPDRRPAGTVAHAVARLCRGTAGTLRQHPDAVTLGRRPQSEDRGADRP